MGTRSITRIQQNGENIVSIYRQYDGYLDGQGKDLAEILKDRKIVNGISFGQERKVFNGVGCLAANIICEMKREDEGDAGSVYIHHPDCEDEEYCYEVDVNSSQDGWMLKYDEYPTVTVRRYGEVIFSGSSQEFCSFVEKDEVFDE